MEYGGFLPIELNEGNEYFSCENDAYIYRLNSARSAVVLALDSVKASKVLVPYYICKSVVEALQINGIQITYYSLNNDFLPNIDKIDQNEWILIVNYFGMFSWERQNALVIKFKRVILDNTQAFFNKPILKKDCFSVYSGRKFFGVSDGSYLISSKENDYIDIESYPLDVSSNRSSFLLTSVEVGTNAVYEDNLKNEELIGFQIKRMSVLSKRIMSGIDYGAVRKKRDQNIAIIHDILRDRNSFNCSIRLNDMMIYPLYIESNGIRDSLIENKVYVPQWWKWVIKNVEKNTVEYKMSKWLYPIPIDQRYNEKDMENLGKLILRITEDCKE